MELSPNHISDLMKRFPSFELSYETISHKKVSPSYNICVAIPQGKKSYAWFSFSCEDDVCFLFDLNREKKISKGFQTTIKFDRTLSLGTLVYGTLIENETTNLKFFIIEDIFYFKGIPLKKSTQQQKLTTIHTFISLLDSANINKTNHIHFSIPVLWSVENTTEYEPLINIPEAIAENISYPIHHIQYRCLYETKPYLNFTLNRKLNFANTVIQESKKEKTHIFETVEIVCDYYKPQYKYPTVFQVTADIQFDVYHLFAYGMNGKPTYYGLAGIPNYKTSVFMNSLFRKIKENINLDSIEESDDEAEFEDMTEDKFVDIQKVLLMECTFHMKFKKWVPLRVIENTSHYIHIGKLIRDQNSRPNHQPNMRHHNNVHGNPHMRRNPDQTNQPYQKHVVNRNHSNDSQHKKPVYAK